MIEVKNLTFSYSRKKPAVLSDFSINIDKGKVSGLLGKNGAGKSTLLYLISGLLTPKSGEVLFNGTNTRRRLPKTLQEIFIIPEEFDLPSISLLEFVKTNAPLYPRFSIDDMIRYLQLFDMTLDLNLGSLSMGQKKKAYMSFALATNTSLILMDEPTNGLDIPGKSQFRKFIAAGMSEERNIIISTHQVRDIDQLLDHIIIINDNEVLLNHDINEISKNLYFTNVDSNKAIPEVLYSHSTIYGTSAILPNTNKLESDINLETLFNLAIEKPHIVKEYFNPNSSQL